MTSLDKTRGDCKSSLRNRYNSRPRNNSQNETLLKRGDSRQQNLSGLYQNSRNEAKALRRKDSAHQLELFPETEISTDSPLFPRYPLQIESIPRGEEIGPAFLCRVVHARTGYRVPGQFTPEEARELLEITRDWDWTIDNDRRPACAGELSALLATFGDRGGRNNA